MGRTHVMRPARTGAEATRHDGMPSALKRGLERVLGGLLLLLALPLMALVALAVRVSSHGTVLHREPAVGPSGEPVQLLSFRTVLDGGTTLAHARVRAAIGAEEQLPVTGIGPALRALRLDSLPRLVNVVAGQRSLF